MLTEYAGPHKHQDGTDSEDFTYYSSVEDTEKDEEIERRTLVLMLYDQAENTFAKISPEMNETARDETILQELQVKLGHLLEENRDDITDLIVSQNIVALSLRGLRPADVPYRHHFELTDERPVYPSPQRLAQNHNNVVQKELKEMLEDGQFYTSSSAWSFAVMIATRRDEKPCICVENCVLNHSMRANSFLLPKFQETFDEIAESEFLTTLDLFSGYWKIKLEEKCKQKTSFVCQQGAFLLELMPFGLMNAQLTFKMMMNALTGHLEFVRVYPDEVEIFQKEI